MVKEGVKTEVFVVTSLLLPASRGRDCTVPVCYQIKAVFSLSTVIIAVSLPRDYLCQNQVICPLYSLPNVTKLLSCIGHSMVFSFSNPHAYHGLTSSHGMSFREGLFPMFPGVTPGTHNMLQT